MAHSRRPRDQPQGLRRQPRRHSLGEAILNLANGPNEVKSQKHHRLGVSLVSSKANNVLPCGHLREPVLHDNVCDPDGRNALGLNSRKPSDIAFRKELPDFVNDPKWRLELVDFGGFILSYYTTMEFWDDLHEEWVVMRQAPNHSPTQVSGRYAVPDMKNWTLDHYFSPDAHDSSDPWHFDEVYGMMSAYLERIVFGFAAWFIGDKTIRP